jgi:heptosyltransferase-1
MYKDKTFPSRILIIKMSSLGDIIQAMGVLDGLHQKFPEAAIDWLVDPHFYSFVSAHPLISSAIPFSLKKGVFGYVSRLRSKSYDLVFDLQGNCKSGLATFFSKAKVKVGFGLKTVREWPNILSTHIRFDIAKKQNIRLFYLHLLSAYFNEDIGHTDGVRFKIKESEKKEIDFLVKPFSNLKIMVCPGSKWANKQLKEGTLIDFLQKIKVQYQPTFFLVWGSHKEKALCEKIKPILDAVIVPKLSIPVWQNLMGEMDLVIAVDSSALHLCATTSTPTFSLFGPTSLNVFKPVGSSHFGLQGICPYNVTFEKQCPRLRTCTTGACLKELQSEELFVAFQNQCDFLQF